MVVRGPDMWQKIVEQLVPTFVYIFDFYFIFTATELHCYCEACQNEDEKVNPFLPNVLFAGGSGEVVRLDVGHCQKRCTSVSSLMDTDIVDFGSSASKVSPRFMRHQHTPKRIKGDLPQEPRHLIFWRGCPFGRLCYTRWHFITFFWGGGEF
jgi:hypothetical protein